MDLIALLDEDVCGKYIWSQVPSSHVVMLLSMRPGTTEGGICTRLDMRKWMISCLQHKMAITGHVIDMNQLIKPIFTNVFTQSREPQHKPQQNALMLLEENKQFYLQCIQECAAAGLRFYMNVSQCTFCSNMQGVTVRYSPHCTRTLPTCRHIVELFAHVVSMLPNLLIFKLVVHGVHASEDRGKQILGHVKTILQQCGGISCLDISNVHCICGLYSEVVDMLSYLPRVEKVSIRNVRMMSPFPADHPNEVSSTFSNVRPVINYLGAACMPILWVEEAVHNRTCTYSHLRSLTISQNAFLPEELMKCADILWRCPSLEELVVVDTRRAGSNGGSARCTNLGLWILTAMSAKIRLQLESSGLSLQYAQLKSITLDIGTPLLQTLNPEGEAVVFMEQDGFPKPWHDQFPMELQDIQVAHDLGVGGDVFCLKEAHMPMLEQIRLRLKDNGVTLSSTVGMHLLHNICTQRLKSGSTKKCKQLVVYSMFLDKTLASDKTEKGRNLLSTFESVEFKPGKEFPFF